jgi:hypothetical protein
VPWNTTPGDFIPNIIGGPQAVSSAQSASVPALANIGQGKFDPAAFIKSFIIPHEGGLNPHDMNGAATNFGINQAANPGVDVTKLTPQTAAQIYMNKYLPMSGAANLSPALGAVHLDTSIINPARAHQFLVQSGGDPGKYMDLRDAWMAHMVQTNPAAAPYAKAWAQRNADLRGLIAGQGTAPQVGAQAAPPEGASTASLNAPGFHALGPTAGPHALVTPQERAAAGINPNDTAGYFTGPDGPHRVAEDPYGPQWATEHQKAFADNPAYKTYSSEIAPTYNALVTNIGQMTGPAAYASLDKILQLNNPRMGTRQAQIDAFEHKFGLPGDFMGRLLNYQGKGSIPVFVRQQILDSAAPIAQGYYDGAKTLRDAYSRMGAARGRSADEMTLPIGDRPERFVMAPTGAALPESAVIAQARQAIHQGRNAAMVKQRLQAMHIDPSGL